MNILYVRTSSVDQNSDRQKINEKDFERIIEDKCSGVIPFFERNGGMQIKKLAEKGVIETLSVWSLDRLGRDLLDILQVIEWFSSRKTPIIFLSQSLRTIDKNGKSNPISKLVLSILGSVAEMTRNQIKESQREGILIAKSQGKYLGRKPNSREDVLKFLSKEKNKKALELLKKDYKAVEISKIVGIHINTVTKIKKLGLTKTLS